jgi:uncharacterized protein involved in outer membrane biogenesis
MKPSTHRLRTSLLILTLLVVVVILAANTVASPDHWRNQFEQLASDAIGKPLHLTGALHWRLGQNGAGLHAEQVTLGNPDWGTGPTLVRAAELELLLSWAGLLRGRIVFERLGLDDVEVHLEHSETGDDNWTFEPKPSDPGDTTSGPVFDPQIALRGLHISYRKTHQQPIWSYHLPMLRIDAEPGQALRLADQIASSTGNIEVAIQTKPLQAIFADSLHWPLTGTLIGTDAQLSASVNLDASTERPIVDGHLDLHWGSLPASSPATSLATSLATSPASSLAPSIADPSETPIIETLASVLGLVDADLRLDLDTPWRHGPLSLKLDDGLARVEAGQPQLKLTWDTHAQPAQMTLDLDGGPWDLATIATQWQLPEPPVVATKRGQLHLSASGLTQQALLDSLQGELTMEQVTGFPGFDLKLTKFTATLAKQSLDLNSSGTLHDLPFDHELTVTGSPTQWLRGDQPLPIVSRGRFGNNHTEFNGEFHHPRTQPRLIGSLKANGKDPSEYNLLFDSSLPKRTAYRIVTSIDIQLQRAVFTDIDAWFGKTRGRGALTVDQTTPHTRINGKLRFPHLDLAGLPSAQPAPSPPPRASTPTGPATQSPDPTTTTKTGIAAILSDYDADIELRIDRLLGTALDVGKLRTHLVLQKGQLKLKALRLSLFGIAGRGSASIQEQDNRIAAQLLLNIPTLTHDVDFGRAPNNYLLRLKTANSRIKLETVGNDAAQWLANTRLDARFDGLSIDIDDQSGTIIDQIRLTRARLDKRVGKDLRLTAKGSIDDHTISIEGRYQARKPGRRGRNARIDASLKVADLDISVDARLSRNDELHKLRIHLGARQPESLPALLLHYAGNHGPYRLDVDIERNRNGWHTDNLSIQSGGNDLSGRVDIDLTSKPHKLVLNLKSKYLKPDFRKDGVPRRTSVTSKQPRTHLIPDTNLVPQVPAHWDVDYRHRIDKLVLAHNTLSQYAASGYLRKDRLVIDELRATLPQGGSLAAKVNARIIDGQLQAQVSGQAKQFDLGWILTKDDIERPIPWLTSTEFNIEGRGRTLREFLAGANGGIRFIGGPMDLDTSAMDLWTLDLVSIAIPNLIKRKEKSEQGLLCSVAGFAIDKGVMTSQGMLFDTPKVMILGSGSIDLRTEKIDLLLSPKKKRLSLFSLRTPALLSGTLMQPKAGIPPEQLALTAGSLTLQVVQPWVLAGALLTSGYRVDNPCLKTFEEMSGKHPDKGARAHSPFDDVLQGIGRAPDRLIQDVGKEIDGVLP